MLLGRVHAALASDPNPIGTNTQCSLFAKAISVAGKRRNRDMNRLDRVLQRKGGFLNRQIAGWRRDDAVSGQTLPDFERQSQPGIAVTTFGIEQAGF